MRDPGKLFKTVRRVLVGSFPVLAAVVGLLLVSGGPAMAANPTFTIVGPAEWNLPIVPSANVFMQTGIIQNSTQAYDGNGNKHDIAGEHAYVGITRFAHLFSYKAIPKVGFYWEALLPEVRVEGKGTGVNGLGDPLFIVAAYARPFPNAPVKSMIGFQNVLSIPVGTSEVSNRYWTEYPTIINDEAFGKFGLDTTLGMGISSDYHKSGEVDKTIGNMYFVETALRYQLFNWLAPFVQYNYQVNEPGSIQGTFDATSNTYVPGGTTYAAGSHESVIGGGVKINFTPDRWLDAWYTSGIQGNNTVQTNAVYFRFVNIF